MHSTISSRGRLRCLLPLALSVSVLVFCGTSSASPKEVLWVDMDAAPTYFEPEPFVRALGVRLPEWKINPLYAGAQLDPCTDFEEKGYLVKIVSNSAGDATLVVESCATSHEATSHEILRETVPRYREPEDGYRRAAVLVSMVLDAAPGVDRNDQNVDSESPYWKRPAGTVGAAPGITIVPTSEKALYSLIFVGGVLFTNGLWPQLGARLSTRITGVTGKGDRASMLDRSFWLGLGYRFDIAKPWFVAPGLFFNYCHPSVENESSDQFKIEEDSLLSRFGVRMSILGGYQFWKFLAVFAELTANVSFAEREYTVRGRQVLNMGLVNLDLALGIQAFF